MRDHADRLASWLSSYELERCDQHHSRVHAEVRCCLRDSNAYRLCMTLAPYLLSSRLAWRQAPEMCAVLPSVLPTLHELSRCSAIEGSPVCQKVAGRWGSM